ncbi:hypothetical protein [Actinomycetospora atypica]|uniref:Uncharacterized protein n=1 Tax=Actinomycetospora atypica TaxID=1290095 RepID=A0ABV9YHQ0_9PSEU
MGDHDNKSADTPAPVVNEHTADEDSSGVGSTSGNEADQKVGDVRNQNHEAVSNSSEEQEEDPSGTSEPRSSTSDTVGSSDGSGTPGSFDGRDTGPDRFTPEGQGGSVEKEGETAKHPRLEAAKDVGKEFLKAAVYDEVARKLGAPMLADDLRVAVETTGRYEAGKVLNALDRLRHRAGDRDTGAALSAEPFYRRVTMTRDDVKEREGKVAAGLADGTIEDGGEDAAREQITDEILEQKARHGDYFSAELKGSLEATTGHSLAPDWYDDRGESRVYAVTPLSDTPFAVGTTAPILRDHGFSSTHVGGDEQVFAMVGRADPVRDQWDVHPVALTPDEHARYVDRGLYSEPGYDERGDIKVVHGHRDDPRDATVTAFNLEAGQSPSRDMLVGEWSKFAGNVEMRRTRPAGD